MGYLGDADIVAAQNLKPQPGSRRGESASSALRGVVILDDDEDDRSGDDGKGWTTFSEFASEQIYLKAMMQVFPSRKDCLYILCRPRFRVKLLFKNCLLVLLSCL